MARYLRKTTVFVLVVALCLGVASVASAGAPFALSATRSAGHYGQSMGLHLTGPTDTVVPGDTFSIQAYQGGRWRTTDHWSIVTTGEVDPDYELPMYYFNDSWTYPVKFRTVYVPVGSVPASAVPSAAITESALKWGWSRVKPWYNVTTPRHGVNTWVGATVTPVSGSGRVKLTVYKPNGVLLCIKYIRVEGEIDAGTFVKFPVAGKYRILMRWLGNAFSVASPTNTTYKYVR